MPNGKDVLAEVEAAKADGKTNPLEFVRHKYLSNLQAITNRNVITYYSGWLQKGGFRGVEINDEDKNGFMMAIHGMACGSGLDLILHTPGGDIAATESLIDYLYRKFKDTNDKPDIRVIIPQLAMSAGTMIACSGKSIMMGKQSSLGPIDPQMSGIPAHGVIEEFKRAHAEISQDASRLAVWQFILQKYQPTFLSQCENAIHLAEEFVRENLKISMFKDDADRDTKADAIVKYLTAYSDRKAHNRHIDIDAAKSIGLVIEDMETDNTIQDAILTIHHCYMHALSNTKAIKIIENHMGQTYAKEHAV